MNARTICPLGEPCLNLGNCIVCMRYHKNAEDKYIDQIDRLRTALAEEKAERERLWKIVRGEWGRPPADDLDAVKAVFQYWLDWQQKDRAGEGLSTSDDTAIIAVPGHWPSRHTLKVWISTMEAARCDLAAAREALELARPFVQHTFESPSRAKALAAIRTAIKQAS